MTNTYEFSNLTTRDQKDYLVELTKLGIIEKPFNYCYEDDLTEAECAIYEKSNKVNDKDVVNVNGTLFTF